VAVALSAHAAGLSAAGGLTEASFQDTPFAVSAAHVRALRKYIITWLEEVCEPLVVATYLGAGNMGLVVRHTAYETLFGYLDPAVAALYPENSTERKALNEWAIGEHVSKLSDDLKGPNAIKLPSPGSVKFEVNHRNVLSQKSFASIVDAIHLSMRTLTLAKSNTSKRGRVKNSFAYIFGACAKQKKALGGLGE